MLLQALAGISLFLFSFFLFSLFSLPVQKATLGTAGPAVKLQMLLQALAGISFSFLLSLSLFSFLFTGSESNVRHGRSRLQTLQMLPQALAGISLFLFSLFLFSLFSLPVQKATLGTAGPAFKRYKCFRRPLQVSLSFSFLSFSFLFSLYRFRKQR